MPSPSPAAARPGPRWRMIVLKSAVLVVVLIFVAQSLRDAVHELDRSDWRLDAPTVVLSAVLYILGLVPAGLYWWWLLRKLGQGVGPLRALQAYFVGHLGKYVPGKAMVVVIRAGMIGSAGGAAAPAGIAVIVETLTMMACGALLALVLVGILVPPDWKLPLAAALAIATGGPTLPPVLNRVLRRMQPAAPHSNSSYSPSSHWPASQSAGVLGWRGAAIGWLAMLAVWALLGMSLAVLLLGLDPQLQTSGRHYLLATAAVALATVAGFLSLLPGGLVVRELILLDLLASSVGDATALVAAVLLRLVWLAAEVVAAAGLSALAGMRGARHRDHS